ncbi:alpha/beta fold hydrolase [Flavimarina sp. Hel_I_48]|uniref:alpha/beta fold hydrolase n=1 Tax=Flavimarina sp. Hel_I_48 TaxID=1392488 RepID=UPI0004DEFB95|nr:alpha/beta fold hydrolase [Flavimarina sp. Hel_I_48]
MKDIHSNILGKGTPFIILHGFLGMGDNWKTLGGRFAEAGYEVHLIDQRNHGRSVNSDDFSYDLMAEDLKKYCDEQKLDQIILLGHSMGGKTAMKFAVNYPDQVSKLLIADIAPKYYAPHHEQILEGLTALQANEDARTSRGDADEFLKQYIQEWGTRQFLLKNLYWKKDKILALRLNLPVLKNAGETIGEALEENERYEGKTLFLRGGKSAYIKDSDFNLIKTHFPESEVITVPDAGHWLHAENPDFFYREVINFL